MSEQYSDRDYDSYGDPDDGMPGIGAATMALNWAGALVSIGLVVGLGVWGYKLTVRDVTEVPVIRALEGLARVQPETPGGQVAAHQGLAVNTVQSDGGVQEPASQVLLAPEPVVLTDDDLAQPPVQPMLATDGLGDTPQNPTDVSAVSGGHNLGEDVMAVLNASENGGDGVDVAALARLPGVKRSPRPQARPLARVAAVSGSGQTDASLETAESRTVDADPSTIVSGTRLVQLGAFDDPETARREWAHILDRHGDLIGSRQRLIQKAESGGRNFYRLRVVGFGDLSDSRRLCSALVARGTPCIPVTAR